LFNIRPTDTPEKLEKSDLSLILNALNVFRNEIYFNVHIGFVHFSASTRPKCAHGQQTTAMVDRKANC
jgi:hypothetical protein